MLCILARDVWKSYLVSSLDYSFGKFGILEFCGKTRLTFGVRSASVLRQRSGLTPIMPSGRRRRQGSPNREGDADSSPLNHLIMQLVESQHDQMTHLLTTLAGRTAPRPGTESGLFFWQIGNFGILWKNPSHNIRTT